MVWINYDKEQGSQCNKVEEQMCSNLLILVLIRIDGNIDGRHLPLLYQKTNLSNNVEITKLPNIS